MQQNWIHDDSVPAVPTATGRSEHTYPKRQCVKILHFYTLPEFWEISADLPYAFVYMEFINADISSGYSHALWPPKVSVK